MISFPPLLVKSAKFVVYGRYENPLAATPAL
jgi:hypothetical protein